MPKRGDITSRLWLALMQVPCTKCKAKVGVPFCFTLKAGNKTTYAHTARFNLATKEGLLPLKD